MGLPLAFAATGIDEIQAGVMVRPRFSRWYFAGDGSRWHAGVPIRYLYQRRAFGGFFLPADRNTTHHLSAALDVRSYGRGPGFKGSIEALRVGWRQTDVEPPGTVQENDPNFALSQRVRIRALDIRVFDTELRWGESLVFQLIAKGGLTWFWGLSNVANGGDLNEGTYVLELGGSLAEPGRYEVGLFLKPSEPFLGIDPRRFHYGSRVEARVRIDPRWWGIGVDQRSVFDQACELDFGVCLDGEAERFANITEAYVPLFGGHIGTFYRANRDVKNILEEPELGIWQLDNNSAAYGGSARWAHEVGIFYRLNLRYDPVDKSLL